MGFDERCPGISRAELHTVVDALADYVALNDITVGRLMFAEGFKHGQGLKQEIARREADAYFLAHCRSRL